MDQEEKGGKRTSRGEDSKVKAENMFDNTSTGEVIDGEEFGWAAVGEKDYRKRQTTEGADSAGVWKLTNERDQTLQEEKERTKKGTKEGNHFFPFTSFVERMKSKGQRKRL